MVSCKQNGIYHASISRGHLTTYPRMDRQRVLSRHLREQCWRILDRDQHIIGSSGLSKLTSLYHWLHSKQNVFETEALYKNGLAQTWQSSSNKDEWEMLTEAGTWSPFNSERVSNWRECNGEKLQGWSKVDGRCTGGAQGPPILCGASERFNHMAWYGDATLISSEMDRPQHSWRIAVQRFPLVLRLHEEREEEQTPEAVNDGRE